MKDIICIILALVFLYLFIFAWVKIFSKAGYHGALGLLMLIPPINIILIFFLGLREWPIYRDGRVVKK